MCVGTGPRHDNRKQQVAQITYFTTHARAKLRLWESKRDFLRLPCQLNVLKIRGIG